MGELHIALFGKAQIRMGADVIVNLSQKAQELLFYLLLHQTRPYTRELLACQLWKDVSPTQSKKYLRQTLWQIQTILGSSLLKPDDSLLVIDNIWVQINPAYENLWLDVASFVRAFKQTQDVAGQDLSLDQMQMLHQAVELYYGELLVGWYQDWCLLERERLQAMYLVMLDKLIVYSMVNQQYESGIEYSMCVLRLDYAHEKTHRGLMRLYYLSGDRTSALRQFERCADILMRELKVKPTSSTQLLYEQIVAGQLQEWLQSPQQRPKMAVSNKGESLLLLELEQIRAYLLLLQQSVAALNKQLAAKFLGATGEGDDEFPRWEKTA